MTGLILTCKYPYEGNANLEITVLNGQAGDWRAVKSNDMFVTEVSTKYEALKQNADNTALNGLKFTTASFNCTSKFVLGNLNLFQGLLKPVTPNLLIAKLRKIRPVQLVKIIFFYVIIHLYIYNIILENNVCYGVISQCAV